MKYVRNTRSPSRKNTLWPCHSSTPKSASKLSADPRRSFSLTGIWSRCGRPSFQRASKAWHRSRALPKDRRITTLGWSGPGPHPNNSPIGQIRRCDHQGKGYDQREPPNAAPHSFFGTAQGNEETRQRRECENQRHHPQRSRPHGEISQPFHQVFAAQDKDHNEGNQTQNRN